MGVYLLFVGTADAQYKGHYLWRQWAWKSSLPCTVAGVLAMTSSEVENDDDEEEEDG
jgi:hypothetical protein